MKAQPAREALDHFAATAIIGLALTGVSDALPVLASRQAALGPATAGYAALSLLTAAGMGLYGFMKSHRADLEAKLAQVLDAATAAALPAGESAATAPVAVGPAPVVAVMAAAAVPVEESSGQGANPHPSPLPEGEGI